MIDPWLISALVFFGTGFLAGFVDSIAGGGGMITLPILFTSGLSPVVALGTNKLQSTFGSLAASLNYRHAKLVRFRTVLAGIAFTALGAVLGTVLVQHIDNAFLKQLIPFLLLGIFLYFLASPKPSEFDRHQRFSEFFFYFLFGTTIGFYDGFFGPGTGSFWAIAFVGLLGMNLKKATAHTKVMNFTSNLVSLAAFAYGGNIHLQTGLFMGIGQAFGASLGSKLVIAKSTQFVRIFFLIAVFATIVKMFMTTYG